MNRHVIKKKFYQEVIFDSHGVRNSKSRVALRFGSLCLKAFGGVLLTLVLAPLSLIRPIEIWYLRSRRAKISLLIEDLEWGLRNLQARKRKVFVIAIYKLPFPNDQLAKMYRRVLLLLGKRQIALSRCLQFVLPIGRINKKNPIERFESMFQNWNDASPTLNFTNKEIKRGLELEKKIFGDETPPFICFAIPSKKYKLAVDIPVTKYHGELIDDPFISIPDLNSYVSVINEFTNSGIAVLRMGSLEEERIPADLGPLAIDYAFDFRSEFGDLWLQSKCLFSLVGAAGSHWFGAIFNKSTVLTDSYSITPTNGNRDLFIPQRGWIAREGRYLTFSEIGSSEFSRDLKLLKGGVEIVKNTPEEICDVSNEMVLRLSGKWVETEEDRVLQARYREISQSFKYDLRQPARMGAKFLREHQYLLLQ